MTNGTAGATMLELQFLEKLQLILAESLTTSTYKYALLIALADICVEDTNAGHDDELAIPITRIAEKFLEIYWRHGLPYFSTGIRDATDSVLLQNRGPQAAVINKANALRRRFGSPAVARRDPSWEQAVSTLAGLLKQMPLWRLQKLRTTTLDFLYPEDRDGDEITLRLGIARCFRRFHALIVRLVQADWMAFLYSLPANRRILGEAGDLADFLFGPQRESLSRARPALQDLHGNRCFYCDDRLPGPGEVDHFIPWSRYPRNLVHNLVIAHRGCNSAKSDVLAAPEHRSRWSAHIDQYDSQLCEIGASNGLIADRIAAIHVADWCYAEAARVGADVWIIADRYQRLAGETQVPAD